MQSSCLIIGRGYQLATALVAALKIKEIAYFHTEGMQAGELKHGTLALVTAKMPIMMIATKDNVYEQVQNALHQIVARKGAPFVVCSEADEFILKGREQYLDILKPSSTPHLTHTGTLLTQSTTNTISDTTGRVATLPVTVDGTSEPLGINVLFLHFPWRCLRFRGCGFQPFAEVIKLF